MTEEEIRREVKRLDAFIIGLDKSITDLDAQIEARPYNQDLKIRWQEQTRRRANAANERYELASQLPDGSVDL